MTLIWVLTGDKTGDNTQVLRAARAMGLPFMEKRIALKPGFDTRKPRVRASVSIIDEAASDPLVAPWPSLVITIGRRLSLPALWIKAQSSGQTRIALFNAPKGQHERFDLIVVPSYYQIADGPRICRIGLPLIAADQPRIRAAGEAFASQFAGLSRPIHVLLLGGDMGSRKFDPAFARQTLETMQSGFAREGSIFASTSRRTPVAAADAVERALRPHDRLHRWKAGATDNPYLALLAHGDSFTVTSDSLSMLTEVARLGKRLVIAQPSLTPSLRQRLGALLFRRPARNLQGLASLLVEGGHAAWLGDPFPAATDPPADDTQRVGLRLRQLALGPD